MMKHLKTKEEKNMITLIEMQDVLGKQIEKCTDEHLTGREVVTRNDKR